MQDGLLESIPTTGTSPGLCPARLSPGSVLLPLAEAPVNAVPACMFVFTDLNSVSTVTEPTCPLSGVSDMGVCICQSSWPVGFALCKSPFHKKEKVETER